MRHASAALRVHGHQVLGLQVSQTGDAAQVGFNTAVRSTIDNGSPDVGSASLHGDEAALLVATQVANVVGDG